MSKIVDTAPGGIAQGLVGSVKLLHALETACAGDVWMVAASETAERETNSGLVCVGGDFQYRIVIQLFGHPQPLPQTLLTPDDRYSLGPPPGSLVRP
jgi:hypothetical protein